MKLLAGLALAVCAAACFDGAIALQAAEARTVGKEHGLRLSLLTRLMQRPRWVAAIALDGLGWPFQLGALALVPLSVVQPALALGLILLLVMGARTLGEPVGRGEILGAGLLAGGVGLLAAGSPGHSDHHASAGTLLVVCGGLGLAVLAPYVLRHRDPLLIVSAGAAYTLAAITSKLLTDELAAGTARGAATWAAVTIVTGVFGKLAETTALQRMPAAGVAAPVFAVQAVVPVIAAPALVGEPWTLLIPPGLLLVLAGTLLLARSRAVLRLVDPSRR